MASITKQWAYMKSKPIHKWEKRWVTKGSVTTFKWVKTGEMALWGKDDMPAIDTEQQEDEAGGMTDKLKGHTRLTRGKAAQQGIVVESIADTNDSLLGVRSSGTKTAEEQGDQSTIAQEAGKKRGRDEDADQATGGEGDAADGQAAFKRQRAVERGGEQLVGDDQGDSETANVPDVFEGAVDAPQDGLGDGFDGADDGFGSLL